MGSFANTLFTILLGWLQTVVSSVWTAFTTPNGKSMLTWIGQHWLVLAAILCAAGAAADLSVYIVRWKPFRVWRSFFSRIRRRGEPQAGSPEPERPEPRAARPLFSGNAAAQAETGTGREQPHEAPDFSRWEEETDTGYQDETAEEPAAEPATVTNAGYIVPADSPYRRPSSPQAEAALAGRDPAGAPVSREGAEQRNEPARSKYRKRRRINVSELFSDPEEELKAYEAPQHMIDRRKAYRDPVYPRSWQKNEDEGQ